jgi:pectinesterase
VRKPSPGHSNVVVVDGTKQKNVLTGIVRQNCSIMADVELLHDRLTVKTYLARPWKPFSRPIFINNVIGDFIQPDGYSVWAPNETHCTLLLC